MARNYFDPAVSDDDEMSTLEYLEEVAPERLDAIFDAHAESLVADAWDEAGHAIAAALCGELLTPGVFTLLPGVDARNQAFIWWAGFFARQRSGCADVTSGADLRAAGGDFFRYESEDEMIYQFNLAWPQVCELAEQLLIAWT